MSVTPETPNLEHEKLLQDYGITPAMARAYLKDTYGTNPEDTTMSGAIFDHDIVAIALLASRSDEAYYLLEDFFREAYEMTQARERQEREAAGFAYSNPLTPEDETDFRRHELRVKGMDIAEWCKKKAEEISAS